MSRSLMMAGLGIAAALAMAAPMEPGSDVPEPGSAKNRPNNGKRYPAGGGARERERRIAKLKQE